MKKVTLKLVATVGSDFQLYLIKNAFETYAKAIKIFYEDTHKKNDIHYQIDTEETQSVALKKQK